jgi:hypothetical protein
MGESAPQKLNWNRLLLIGVVLSAIIVAAMLCYAARSVRRTYQANTCRRHNLALIAQAAEAYASLYSAWPESVEQLAHVQAVNPSASEHVICPSAQSKGLPEPHYAVAPGRATGMPDSYVLVYELHHVHGGKRHVCFVGGKVELWGHDRDAELEGRLESQRQAAKPGLER